MVSDSRELSKEDSELRYLKRSRPFVVCLFVIDSCLPMGRQFALDESSECCMSEIYFRLFKRVTNSHVDRQRFNFQTRCVAQFLWRVVLQKRHRDAHFARKHLNYCKMRCDLRKGLSRRKLEIASVCLAYRLKASFAFRDGPWNVLGRTWNLA